MTSLSVSSRITVRRYSTFDLIMVHASTGAAMDYEQVRIAAKRIEKGTSSRATFVAPSSPRSLVQSCEMADS